MQIKKRNKLSDHIVTELTNAILRGEFEKGSYLPSEGELCIQYDVSRSTIREAVKSLQERGLAERQHGKGILVVNRTMDIVAASIQSMANSFNVEQMQLIDVRSAVEVRTAMLAAENADDQDIREMEKTLAVMNDSSSDIERYLEHDFKFHILVAQASKNKIFEAVLRALEPLLMNEISLTLEGRERPERLFNYHKKILQMIKKNNPDGAKKSMLDHLRATEAMIRKEDVRK